VYFRWIIRIPPNLCACVIGYTPFHTQQHDVAQTHGQNGTFPPLFFWRTLSSKRRDDRGDGHTTFSAHYSVSSFPHHIIRREMRTRRHHHLSMYLPFNLAFAGTHLLWGRLRWWWMMGCVYFVPQTTACFFVIFYRIFRIFRICFFIIFNNSFLLGMTKESCQDYLTAYATWYDLVTKESRDKKATRGHISPW
jgi:hypothetical protein